MEQKYNKELYMKQYDAQLGKEGARAAVLVGGSQATQKREAAEDHDATAGLKDFGQFIGSDTGKAVGGALDSGLSKLGSYFSSPTYSRGAIKQAKLMDR